MSVGTKLVTTGRGGAGNIGSPKLKPVDAHNDVLNTPTLKSHMYTTGRGGSGNMAKNDKGVEARKAQDIDPVLRREGAVGSTVSIGRGGGGNMIRDKPRQASGVSELARDVLRKIRSNSSRRTPSQAGSGRSSVSSDQL